MTFTKGTSPTPPNYSISPDRPARTLMSFSKCNALRPTRKPATGSFSCANPHPPLHQSGIITSQHASTLSSVAAAACALAAVTNVIHTRSGLCSFRARRKHAPYPSSKLSFLGPSCSKRAKKKYKSTSTWDKFGSIILLQARQKGEVAAERRTDPIPCPLCLFLAAKVKVDEGDNASHTRQSP